MKFKTEMEYCEIAHRLLFIPKNVVFPCDEEGIATTAGKTRS